MSKSFLFCYGSEVVGDGTTRYTTLGGRLDYTSSTESRYQITMRDAGVFSNFISYISANSTLVDTTVTLRKNLGASSLVLTYTSGQTGFKEDNSTTVSVASGDEFDHETTVANDVSGSTSVTMKSVGVQFEPTTESDSISMSIVGTQNGHAVASTTRYFFPNEFPYYTTTEANTKYRVRSPFVSSYLTVNISSNSRTTDTVFGTRKNGGGGSQSVTYTSGQTGFKEDSSNTDSYSTGDDFNYYITTGTGTETINVSTISSRCANTSNSFLLLAGRSINQAIAFNTTTYMGVAGDLIDFSTTDSNSQTYTRFNFTAKEFGSYVNANTIATDPSTITLRDDGADSSVTVSYNAAQTGLKNDTTNSAEIVSGGDEINYKVVTPNTSGNLTLGWIGIVGETRFNRSPVGVAASGAASFQF